jgi:glycosyltransferase involved in cell wall biosynthesis
VRPPDPPGTGPNVLLYTRFFEFSLDRPLEVFRRVQERYPGARLVIAGAGLHGEEKVLLGFARERGMAGAVELRGWVEPDQAAPLFRAADIAIYPFNDTLVNRTKSPVKLLELMGAGLPVVAESVGELAEVIEGGVSGLLVPSGDVEGLAAAILHLWEQPGLRERLGEGARRRIAGHYIWDVNRRRLEAFYLERRPALSRPQPQ